jgi:hypothetical protein
MSVQASLARQGWQFWDIFVKSEKFERTERKHAILAKIDIGNSLAESAWQSRF